MHLGALKIKNRGNRRENERERECDKIGLYHNKEKNIKFKPYVRHQYMVNVYFSKGHF